MVTFGEVVEKMAQMHEAKEQEYGDSYGAAAAVLGCSRAHIMLTRLAEKVARLGHSLEGFGAKDAAMDAAVIAALIYVELGTPRRPGEIIQIPSSHNA